MSMMIVGIAGAAATVIGGVMSDRSANKNAAKQRNEDRLGKHEDFRLGMKRAQFDASLEEHYKQKERAGRQRGLDQFRKFSTMGQFAPEVADTSPRIVVPEAPNVSDTPAWDQAAANAKKDSGGLPGSNLAGTTPYLLNKVFG